MSENIIHTNAKRKSARARVYMNALSKATEHHIMINNRPLNDYFCGSDGCSRHLNEVLQPLKLVDGEYFNIKANVNGGGLHGQSGALLLALAKALVEHNPELRSSMKQRGYLTSDARKVERQKAGQKGARAGNQWKKR